MIEFPYKQQYPMKIEKNRKEYLRDWRRKHPAKVKEYEENYREAHREQMRISNRKCYQSHHEQRLESLHRYYQSHREQILERGKLYRQTHQEEIRKRNELYHEAHREERLEYARQYKKVLRDEVLSHYGGNPPRCACCREEHIEFLCIDHISGGGAKHRKSISEHFYFWLKKNEYPEGYRVLCQNCNSAYGHYGYCPHQLQREGHKCPIGLDKVHCQNCFFSKEGVCDWPHGQDGSVVE